jgi:CRP-like cAMP-binding protein
LHLSTTSPLDNKLLAALPRRDFDLLAPSLTTVSLPQGMIVCEAGSEVDHVYFPHSGMFSLLVIMQDGRAIETATIGREGVVGAMAGLGLYQSLVRATVQLPLAASKIAAASFRKAIAASGALHDLCVSYNEVMLTQARLTAACNALHQVDERFCRWLLQSADRAAGDTVTLTQELLAEMLGVRRTSVTEVARRMQDQGIITYARGVITILDRPGLEKLSCECYQTLLEHEATLTN